VARPDTEAAKAKLQAKYRNKESEHEKELYKQIKDKTRRFLTREMLESCYHCYDSQKNEAMNKKVSKYAPKNRTYSRTLSLRSRVCMAVGTDGAGTKRFFEKVFREAGIPVNKKTSTFLKKVTAREEKKKEYQKKRTVKFRRARNQKLKTAKGMQDNAEARRQGQDYGTGIAILGRNDAEDEETTGGSSTRKSMDPPDGEVEVPVNKRPKKCCSKCGSTKHSRSTAKSCPKHSLYNCNAAAAAAPAPPATATGTATSNSAASAERVVVVAASEAERSYTGTSIDRS
jgi:hypothetical protein